MADMSDLIPIQRMTLPEHCSKEEWRALHGLLLMRSSANYSAAPASVEEMERAVEAKEERRALHGLLLMRSSASYSAAL